MTDALTKPCTAFQGDGLLSSGPLIEVALAVKNALEQGTTQTVLVFDDATGRVVDLDLRGSKADIIARLLQPQPSGGEQPSMRRKLAGSSSEPDGRAARQGPPQARRRRPRGHAAAAPLGMAGGAAGRRFGDAAPAGRRGQAQRRRRRIVKRAAQEAAYRFMLALAGNLPGFEEAIRPCSPTTAAASRSVSRAWPQDVRDYATRLAFGPDDTKGPEN